MVTTHPSRIFTSGKATTLYVTVPAQVVTDSQFPFQADDVVSVRIDGDSLVVTADPGDRDTDETASERE